MTSAALFSPLPVRPIRTAAVAIASLILVGCGGPAPGEALVEPLAQKPMPALVSASEALGSPDLTQTDPATMDEAEIEKVLPDLPRCGFSYSAASNPIFAAGFPASSPSGGQPGASGINQSATGVTKIHGRLVSLSTRNAATLDQLKSGGLFTAGGITVQIALDEKPMENSGDAAKKRPATLLFELEQGLKAGYRGWYGCKS